MNLRNLLAPTVVSWISSLSGNKDITQRYTKGQRISGLALILLMALVVISTFSVPSAYAATSPKKHQVKPIGAEFIINGHKYDVYTPASPTKPLQEVKPLAQQNCAIVAPSESNIYISGGYAYFKYSLSIGNGCPVNVTTGYWKNLGSIVCSGVSYANPPSSSGGIPSISPGKFKLVQDQVPYKATCLGSFAGFPYVYAPSQISISAFANGALANGNTWSSYETDTFTP